MTNLLRLSLLSCSLLFVAPRVVWAQERSPERAPERAPERTADPDARAPEPQRAAPIVPRNMMPPAGKCRIWMEGIASAQQPAPTDCQTALRQRPSNGTVVFGPSTKEPAANAFGSRATSRRNARRDSTARDTTTRRRPPEPQS